MIKVLVVEDEPPILRSICRKINQTHKSFEIIGTAYNGQEAVEFLKQNPVDVVFTDVSMPIMDGIGLLKYISDNNLDMKTVLISGYQEFSYAKSAIKYGAVDYLLKPLDDAQLESLLTKLYDQYRLKQKNKTQSILFNSRQAQETKAEQAPAKSDASMSLYMILFCIGSITSIPLDIEEQIVGYWNQFDLESTLKKELSDDLFFWIIPGKSANENILILNNLPPAELERILRVIDKRVRQCGFPLHAVASEELQSMNHIKPKYGSLRHLLQKSLVFGVSDFFREKDLIGPASPVVRTDDDNELKITVQKGNFKQIQKLLKQDFTHFEKLYTTQIHLELYLRNTLLLCSREGFIKISLMDIETNVQLLIGSNLNYEDLSENFIKLLWTCHTETDELAANDTQALISKIDHFIRQHLAEPITNQMLSSHFGLTPSYLSRLFKEYKELTPMEYITHLRIEKAKTLLSGSQEFLVKDVAQIIGYSDPLYFSRVFKKQTGIYPTEYQNQHIQSHHLHRRKP